MTTELDTFYEMVEDIGIANAQALIQWTADGIDRVFIPE